MSSDDDDWNADVLSPELLLKVYSIEPRQSNIENKATWKVRSFSIQKLLSRGEQFRLQSH